ncbi:MAG: hypothetical protein H7A01_05455 [Hahellaceae bacterium]|nr:hypothetical protein [Hahellaceae bacterium]MCP5212862.1 hypothetical protein [Hahellaceae bacterium]
MNARLLPAQPSQCKQTLTPRPTLTTAATFINLIDDGGREVPVSQNMIDQALQRAERISLGHVSQ